MKLLTHLPLLIFCMSTMQPSLQKTDSCKVERAKTKKQPPRKDAAEPSEGNLPVLFSIITNKF